VRVCAVSYKESWRDASGRWFSTGGFPRQMQAIGSLFDAMTLVITEGPARPGGIALPDGARIVALPTPGGQGGRRKLAILARLPRYLGAIREASRDADVIHVPLPGDIPLLAMLFAIRARKRLLARYGGSWVTTSETTIMNRLTRQLMRSFAGGRNVMLATGEADRPPARGLAWVFSTAMSRAEWSAISVDLDRGLSDPPRLSYVGRLSREKGVDVLVEALAQLRAEGFSPLPRVTLIGDGPERERLGALVGGLACQDLITFAGQADRRDLSRLLSRTDVVVQPSRTEGFSKAWIDALAHGVPVLASEVGAARSVLGADGERGWLLPPGEVGALARGLRRLATERVDWPALRRRCRAYAGARTLEAWASSIGTLCADQWGIRFQEGRLVA